MGIQHEVYHVIRRRHVEAVAEPVQRHLGGGHGVKHEILEFSQAVSHQFVLCHADMMAQKNRLVGGWCTLCGLSQAWYSMIQSEAADQFVLLSDHTSSLHKLLHIVVNSDF